MKKKHQPLTPSAFFARVSGGHSVSLGEDMLQFGHPNQLAARVVFRGHYEQA